MIIIYIYYNLLIYYKMRPEIRSTSYRFPSSVQLVVQMNLQYTLHGITDVMLWMIWGTTLEPASGLPLFIY